MDKHRIARRLKRIYEKSDRDKISIYASSLAFTTFISFIPMLAMAYALFNAFGGVEKLNLQLNDFILSNLTPDFGTQILKYMKGLEAGLSPKALGIFGFLGFAYTTFSLIYKIEACLTMIFQFKAQRTWVRRITNYWTLMTLGPLLLGLSIYLSSQALIWLKHDTGEISKLLTFVVGVLPIGLSTFLITGLYVILPTQRIRIPNALAAGLAASLSFEIAKQAYALYATRALSSSLYGALAVIPVFCMWVYIAWMIVLIGAEICYELERTHHPEKETQI